MEIFRVLILVFSICISCNKELDNYTESIKYCTENFVISCSEPVGLFNFTGSVKGSQLCVSDGVDGYWIQNGIVTESVTSTQSPVIPPGTPSLSTFYTLSFIPPIFDNLNGIIQEFAPLISISSPHLTDTVHHTQAYYLENFFKKGDVKLRDRFTDKYSGYDFRIYWNCVMLPGYNYYYNKNPAMIPSVGVNLSPAYGVQNNAGLHISEFTKTINDNWATYDITLQITCDLYFVDGKFYGRLEHGEFKTRIVVPVDE